MFQVIDSNNNNFTFRTANTVSSLPAGQSTTIAGSIPVSGGSSLPAGTYRVRACANENTSWGGSIAESNPNNNCGAYQSFTVQTVCYGQGCTPSNPCSGGSCSCSAGWSGQPKTGTPSACCSPTAGVCPALPTATLSVVDATVDVGQSTTLHWNSQNATACTGTGFTAGGPSGSRGTGTLNTPGTQPYQVICTGSGGASAPAFASVDVLQPTATISANPARVKSGSSTTLTWSGSSVKSCTVSGPGVSVSGNATAGSFTTGSPKTISTVTAQSVYTITCQTNGSPVTDTVIVNLLPDFTTF
jgi:hypothetical protein